MFVAAVDALAADTVLSFGLAVAEGVPRGHKLSDVGVGQGQPVRKFGQIISFAGRDLSLSG